MGKKLYFDFRYSRVRVTDVFFAVVVKRSLLEKSLSTKKFFSLLLSLSMFIHSLSPSVWWTLLSFAVCGKMSWHYWQYLLHKTA